MNSYTIAVLDTAGSVLSAITIEAETLGEAVETAADMVSAEGW